ncbi:hypothetical protein TRE132_48430 [Pseudomonas chlororaphis subsp. aurantiaca]|nr:hypothetical protein TRE132_48430 [Pseudomonas chlororaphis subsp. aurantiaca]
MRNISIDRLDHTPRAVVAIGTDYPHGHLLPSHSHRRAQLLYGATGVMQVSTTNGRWVVPPQRAVWIPPRVAHEVLMLGVSTRSLYIEPEAMPALGDECQVISVSPLMRQLLMEAVDLPLVYDEDGRDGVLISLLLHELSRTTRLPLHIPCPKRRACSPCARPSCSSPMPTSPPSNGRSSCISVCAPSTGCSASRPA